MAVDPMFVLNPIGENLFFSDYFEKKILHISRNKKGFFDSLLTINDIDEYIANQELFYPDVLIKNKIKQKEFQPWAFELNKFPTIPIDKERLYQELSQGETLILNSLQKKIPKFNQYITETANRWGVRLSANIYITPAQNQGLDWHCDYHDVLVFQIEGSKKWNLVDETPSLIDRNVISNLDDKKDFTKCKEILLNEGDTLYIPRGIYHMASSENNNSTHITLGITSLKINSIFEAFLKDSFQQREFRYSFNKINNEKSKAELLEEIKVYAKDYFQKLNEEDLSTLWEEQQNKLPQVDHVGRLKQILKKDIIQATSKVYLNPLIDYKLKIEDKLISIYLSGKTLKFPLFLKPFIESICQKKPIKINETEGKFSEKHKIELVQKFVGEGILLVAKEKT